VPRYADPADVLPERYADPADLLPEEDEPEYGLLDRVLTTGLRVVPSIAGAAGGAALGAGAAGVGAAPGLMMGGAAGGAAGEWLAQAYERARGLRADYSPGAIAVEGALGAIPIGKAATVARAAAKGAGMSTAGTALHAVVEEGELPDAFSLTLSAGLGALLGGGADVVSRRLAARRTPLDPPRTTFHEFVAEDVPGTTPRTSADDLMDEAAAARDLDEWLQSQQPSGIRVQPATAPYDADADVVERLARERAVDRAIRQRVARERARAGSEFAAYAARDAEMRADPHAAFEAVIPDRLKGPPPRRYARWEDLDPRTAPPAERALRWLIPERVLKGGGFAEAAERARRGAADYTPLQRLFEPRRRPRARPTESAPHVPPSDAPPAMPPVVDRLDTGETQPRLPEAGVVRDRDVPTPTFEAPFALTSEASRPSSTQFDLLGSLLTPADTPSVPWLQRVVDDAVARGYPGTAADVEQDIVQRARALYDAERGAGATERTPTALLEAIRRAGGIRTTDADLSGELRRLREFKDPRRVNSIAGVQGVFRRQGHTLDDMAVRLSREHGWTDLTDPAVLLDAIEDAAVAARAGRADLPAFNAERYAEGAGVRLGEPWWDDAPPFVRELAPELVDEPGAAGRISAELAATLGSSVAGGLAGTTQGETPEERIAFGLGGAVAGGAGAHALARFLSGRSPRTAAPTPKTATTAARTIRTPTGPLRDEPGDVPILETAHVPAPPAVRQPKAQREGLGLEAFPEEQRAPLQALINDLGYDPLDTQRRHRQPVERTMALAQHMRINTTKKLAPGANMNAAGHAAYGNMVATVQDKLRRLSVRIQETGGADPDLLELGQLNAAREALFYSYAGLRTEAGRALQIYSAMKRIMPSELRLVREMLDRGRLRKDMAELAEVFAKLPDDSVQQWEILRRHDVRTLSQRVSDYYMSNILSGVQTQLRNVFGNASRTLVRMGTKATAGSFDALRTLVTGRERQVFTREAFEEAKGIVAGFDQAWRDTWETATLGFSPRALNEGLEDVTDLYVPHREFAGRGRNPLNWPHRGMEAADRFFRNLNASMEWHALTYAQARREVGAGATDDALAKRVAELRLNPSKELRRQMARSAERAVYQEDPGPAINHLAAIKKHVPALQFVFPFVQTAHNILRQGAEHSPLGFFMARARAGDLRERTIAQAEAAVGSLALMPIAYLAATDRLSGSGPRDPAERAALYERGWRPNAVNMPLPDALAQAFGASKSDDGTYWVSYQLAQPFAFPASILANAFEAFHEVTRDAQHRNVEESAQQITAQAIARIGRSALDQSYLSGVSNLVKAVNDPDRSASSFLAQLAGGFVPLSGAMRNAARVVDPVVRDPETISETIQTGIPVASRGVQPRLDRWGEEITREGSSPLVVPEVEPVERDWIAEELARLGISVGLPSDRLSLRDVAGTARQLAPEEAQQIRQMRGRTTRATLGAVMGSPGYAALPDAAKAVLVQRAMRAGADDVNDIARAALNAQRPDLLRFLTESTRERAADTYR